MNGIELVKKRNGVMVTSSLQVSEVFEKEHKNIMQTIDNLTAENSAVKEMFQESMYVNERGRGYRMYYMDKDGFSLLAMGFNGKKALSFKLKYINEFNKMEEYIKNQIKQYSYMIEDPVERAEKWIEEEKERQLLLEQVEQQKPKVILAESIENSNDLILIRDLAVILRQNNINIGQNRLFAVLREQGYLVKGGTSKNLPTQRSVDLGLFRITEGTRTGSEGTKITKTTKVTGKGQLYFTSKFLKEVK